MADTVWSQIVVLFDGFFRSMSLYVVFTVFTSLMSLFWSFPFKPPSKIRPERDFGTKASVPSGRIFEGGYKLLLIWSLGIRASGSKRGNLFCVLIQDSEGLQQLQCRRSVHAAGDKTEPLHAHLTICKLDLGMRHAREGHL